MIPGDGRGPMEMTTMADQWDDSQIQIWADRERFRRASDGRAIEVKSPTMTEFRAAPVRSMEIVQPSLHRLTAPLDVLVRGIYIRLPVGTTISLTAGGSGGMLGHTMSDIIFRAIVGGDYLMRAGAEITIPSPERCS